MDATESGRGAVEAVEQELKFRLTPAGLAKVRAALGEAVAAPVVQLNHYVDDANRRLGHAAVMLRLRTTQRGLRSVPERACWTLKQRRQVPDNGVFIADEVEAVAPLAMAKAVVSAGVAPADLPSAVSAALAARVDAKRLHVVGTLQNTRWTVDHLGHTLELDLSLFPGDVEEAEIECETSDVAGARQVIEALAARCGVTLETQTRGKYVRFLAYQRQAGGASERSTG